MYLNKIYFMHLRVTCFWLSHIFSKLIEIPISQEALSQRVLIEWKETRLGNKVSNGKLMTVSNRNTNNWNGF